MRGLGGGQHRGYALVHDTAAGKTGVFMLFATARITGIEDPQVLQKPVHAFFEFDWRELTALIKRNPWDLAMAVNNKSVRTQDQLLVHLGCVRDDIRTNLDHASLSNQWSDIKLHGHPFIALQVDSLSRSPFEILQAYLVFKGEQIGDYALAVVGRDHGKFVLLATRSAAELVMDEGVSFHK